MGDSFILRKRYNQSGVRSLELGVILLEKNPGKQNIP